ncbi:MAG: SDR family NAD(P)-dependent oxidoreductase [Cyanobacteria bacterium J06558_2]
MLNSLGELYVRGVKVNWRGFDQDYLRRRVILPTYPFQRQRYWLRSSHYQKLTQKQSLTTGQTIHPFLGEKLNCAGEQKIFTAFLSKESPAYLRHHQVFSQAVFPTTAYLEMAVALGNHLWKQDSVIIEQLSIRQGLIFPTAELRKVQTILTPDHNHSYQLQIYSQPQDKEAELEWILHATALVRKEEARSQADINLRQYQDNCSQAIDVLQHYQQCRRMGLNYGSSFQGIKQLWAGSNQALGLIQLPAELVGNTTDYHLHPALLDAALQVSLQISSATSREQTYLPVGVEEFQIYGTPGLELWAYASFTEETRENQDSQKINVVLISPQGELVASIKALEVKLVTASALMGTQAESITDWLYEIDWRSQGLLGRLGAPDFLLPPKSIAQKLAPELKELVNQINDNRTSDLVSSLEELCLDYIVQGLLEIGWSYSVGETFDPDAAASRWGVVPSQMRLFQHLLQVLSARGILESTAQQWQVQRTLESVNPTAKNQSLQHQFPDEEATLNLLDRCASQLYRVLRGAADPVPLVFPPGDLTTSAHMDDDDAPVAQVINTMMQQAITQATAQLPAYRGLRLLEIGAGTGGTTSYILPHLNPHQAQYSFTDLERSYTAKAQARFLNYQFLDYQTLDIEQDPSSQEFASHHYDVVVAANVLHETTNIQEALSNVKQLLAPGGILVLSEATAPRLWLDLTYGLLAGWWKFQDHELRPDYPLLDCSQWQEVLAESGFTEIAALPEIGETAVIVARAPKIEPAVSTAKNWLLLADERGIAQQLAEQITSAGDVCTLVFPGSKYHQVNATEFRINPHNPAEYEQLIAELSSSRSLHGVVQCWSTTSETDKAMDSEELEQLSFLGCGTTLSLVQALVGGELSSAPRLWLVSCGSQPVPMTQPVIPAVAQSSLWGIGKVISLEHPELNCRRIDLDPEQSIEQQAQALFEEIWAEDREDQVAWRGDTRYVARLIPSSYQQDQHLIPSEPFKLKIAQKGNLDSLTFEAVTRRSPGLGEVEIRVKATGMNFRDVLIALDIYPGEPILGGDCAGEIVAVGTGVTGLKVGDSVIAMAPGSFSKYVTLNASYVVLKPENLNFEQAASIPVNFLTAEYALHHLAKITPGDKVLIHAAAGGTGMAAVQIAQAAGAEVFATASPGKWSVLKEMGVQHVMNSRTLEFAEQIMSLTEGEGVDIVLNSLTSGEFISRSVDVLNSQGRFIELALRDIWNYERMKESKPNIAYLPMNLFEISQRQPQLIKKLLQKLMDQLSNGLLQPPPLQAFTLERIIDAFRYMQQAKHIGKIVVTQTAESDEADTQKSLSFLSDATYLITGGTGGLGLTVAEWMISKGAKNLVLVARSSPNAAAKSQLTELEQTGAKVVLEKADVSDATAMKDILHRIKNSKVPLAGIIHAAGMLSDGVLVNQTWSSFEEVMAAKVQGAWHLHQLTQNQPLDFFVLFSSISSLFGSSGQGNYAAANGFLDGLAHYRRARGLPGLSINWGAISQVGQAAQRGADIRLARQGIGVISPTQVLECLELMMADTANAEGNVPPAEVGMVPIDWSAWREAVTQWSFLSDWQNITRTASQSSDSEFLLKLQATAPEERYALLVAHIRRQLSLVLGINNPESISLEAVFFDLGMDSLTAVELRNKLQTSLGCSVPSTIVFDYPTVGELVDYLAQEMLNIELADTSVTKSPEAKEEKQAESQMQELAEAQQLSEEDLEQKIKDKLNLLITEES